MKIGPFENVRQLLGCYRFMKADVQGVAAVLPRPDQNDTDNYQVFASRAAMVDKHCFIADIENCCKWYAEQRFGRYGRVPIDCVSEVFIGRQGFPQKTFGQMALKFQERIKRGDRIPKLLQHKHHIRSLAIHIRENIEPYFIEKGYIE